jgi:sirohydrochlorin ferrochelatase
MSSSTTGIVIFAHGSSVASANQAVEKVALEASIAAGFSLFETAFLDAKPDLRAATGRLAALGVDRILGVPYFLTLGIHLQRDLPALVRQLESEFPGIDMRVAPPLDGHPGLSRILADRALEIMAREPISVE